MEKLTYLIHYFGAYVDPDRAGVPQVDATDTQFNSLVAGGFALAGAISVIFVIVGGIRYIMSEGEPGKTEQAKNTVIYAAVGLAVTALSYVLVRFVIEIARG